MCIINIIEQWLAVNRMVPNSVKTKKLLIGTVQKLRHSGTDRRTRSLLERNQAR